MIKKLLSLLISMPIFMSCLSMTTVSKTATTATNDTNYTFKKYSCSSSLPAGKYLIVYGTSYMLSADDYSSDSNYRAYVTPTISNDTITISSSDSNHVIWKITHDDSYYRLYNESKGVYLRSYKNGVLTTGNLKTTTDSTSSNITFDPVYSDGQVGFKNVSSNSNFKYIYIIQNYFQLGMSAQYFNLYRLTNTVTFNANGHGTAPSAQTIYDGGTATTPTAPTATGYTFGGWYTDSACKTAYNFSTAVTSDITLYAKWTANSYTITYKDGGGGTFSGTHASGYPTKHTYGTATSLKTATKTGYTFGGWYKESGCSNKVTSLGATAYTSNITLYAKWTINSYKITASAGTGGSVTGGGTYNYNKSVTLKATANAGYTFKNWTESSTEVSTSASYTFTVSKARTLVANFTLNSYSITYNLNGGTNHSSNPSSYTVTTDTITLGNPTRSGYDFAGWYENASFTGDKVTQIAKGSTGNKTLYAKWTPKTYKITTVSDPTVGGSTSGAGTYDFTSTHTLTATASTGYTFSGWYENDTLISSNESFSYTLTKTSDVTLTAKFTINKYTVTWKNYDGTVLETDQNVEYGTTPSYEGSTPTKSSTAQYTYTFSGWDNDITQPITGDTIFTAQYNSTVNKYTIKFVNYDDSELQSSDVEYGATPEYVGVTPTKPRTDQYSYSFKGWDKEITSVTGAATYKAEFNETVNKYTITWKNYDDSVIKTDQVEYGTTPTYTGTTPTKPATAEHSYTFSNWSPSISSVTGDATYTAQFNESTNQYTVKFINYDGSILQSNSLNYGTIPTYEGTTPSKPSTAQYTYTFSGWDNDITQPITGDITYTAQFSESVNKYTIKFVNYDGTILQTDELEYGTTPNYTGETPVKPEDEQYKYIFSGWSPSISSVTGEATYTAQFSSTTQVYTVTYKNYDDTELQKFNVEYGSSIPEYSLTTPSKPSTAQYTYTFTGWSLSNEGVVTGNLTYIAQYSQTVNQYTVNFVNYDGTILQSGTLDYGTIPTYTGDTPIKSNTPQYTYTFSGWDKEIVEVTGNVTYTAQFSETVNKYTVKFVNYDDTLLQNESLDYGDTPIYKGETPTREKDQQYSYVFKGWSPSISTVTGDVTYKAEFNESTRVYDIIYQNDDGTILQKFSVEYGEEIPSYSGDIPVKTSTPQYSYTFTGWSIANSDTVTSDITFVAQYKSTINQYKVKYVNEDGTELQSNILDYGSDIPEYIGDTPKKASTPKYSYEFIGFKEDINSEKVTGNITYVAQFKDIINQYLISFDMNGHGEEIKSLMVDYDSKLVAPDTPVCSGFVFEGWYKDAEFNNAWNFDIDKVDGTIILYAKWSVASNYVPVIVGASVGGTAAIGGTTLFICLKKKPVKIKLKKNK